MVRWQVASHERNHGVHPSHLSSYCVYFSSITSFSRTVSAWLASTSVWATSTIRRKSQGTFFSNGMAATLTKRVATTSGRRKALAAVAMDSEPGLFSGMDQLVTTNEDVDPPIILSDGKTFEARTTKNTRDKKGHTDFKIYNRSNLIGGTFCQMDRTYNIQFKARLVSIRKAQTDDAFIIGVQFWGHSYLDHSGSKSPPLVWMTDDKKWEVFSYGAPRPSSQSKWFRSNAILGPPDDGWHEWRITYRPSLSNGLVVIYRDGIRRDVAIGKPTAIFASSGGQTMPGPLLRMGVYSSKSSEHSIIQYRDIVYTVD